MKSTQEKHNHKKVLPQTAFDLICGMEVDPALAKHRAEYNDEIYYFCSTTCKNHFVMDPQKYLGS
jgi:YHS domain-containing protein